MMEEREREKMRVLTVSGALRVRLFSTTGWHHGASQRHGTTTQRSLPHGQTTAATDRPPDVQLAAWSTIRLEAGLPSVARSLPVTPRCYEHTDWDTAAWRLTAATGRISPSACNCCCCCCCTRRAELPCLLLRRDKTSFMCFRFSTFHSSLEKPLSLIFIGPLKYVGAVFGPTVKLKLKGLAFCYDSLSSVCHGCIMAKRQVLP